MGLTVTSLISRNIYVNGHRTSIRLEPEVWRALEDITGFESQSINALCAMVHKLPRNGSLTSGMRTFTMLYCKERVGYLMAGSGPGCPGAAGPAGANHAFAYRPNALRACDLRPI